MSAIDLDDDTKWQACLARNVEVDGLFYIGVRTTGIFCRPICPGRPKRENVVFLPSRDLANAAGFRACKRCKP
jgi:methylphosphotriester-DNA--protein-cysteine methyltransferase